MLTFGGVRLKFNRKNSELRTDNFTKMTVDTLLRLRDHRWMVPLAIEMPAELQNVPGAELDTVAAPFAAIFNDGDHPPGDLNLLGIKGYSPKCHSLCL